MRNMKNSYLKIRQFTDLHILLCFVHRRIYLTLLLGLVFVLSGHAQKGNGGNKDVTLHTCIQILENGLIRAEFGYTNPTNKNITVGEDDSVVFLSDKDDDNETNGIQKIMGLTTFEPGTHDKVFGVVFNSGGHAKWTVTFGGNNETKIRATAASTVCVEPCVVCPVYGGAGKSFTPLGAELTALATDNAGDLPSDIIFQINEQQKVLIEIIPKETKMAAVLALLTSAPFNIPLSDFIVAPQTILDKGFATIDVFFPIVGPPPLVRGSSYYR